MSPVAVRRSAVGAADLTIEACLIVTRAEAAARDLRRTERLRSPASVDTQNRPPMDT